MRGRGAFIGIMIMQGAWWTWSTILTTRFARTHPTFDWFTPGFGAAFTVFLLLILNFQLAYMYLFFVVGYIARTPADVVRLAVLLRCTESAAQAVSYGLASVGSFARVGGSALNFGLWGFSLLPAWLVVREIGGRLGDMKEERDRGEQVNEINVAQQSAAEVGSKSSKDEKASV